MKTTKNDVPKAMRDVWAWRKAVHEDLHGLSVEEMIHAITGRADEAALRLGFCERTQKGRAHLAVAEDGAEYGKGR